MKEFIELKQLFISKMDEMKKDIQKHENTIQEHENTIQENKNTIQEHENTIQELKDKLLIQEKKNIEKNIRFQVLNEMISIEDQDLEFNLPLKNRNCFHVKDVQKARDLGGIPTLKDLERVIDNDEYKDIIEVKNTLTCLESVIDEWKNEKLKLVELEQEIQVKQDFSQWKIKDHSILTQTIFDKLESDQFKNFELIKRIENDFIQMARLKRGQIIDVIYKNIIDSIIIEWKTNDSYDDEVKDFINLIPIDSSNLQELKKKFEWKMIPKWEKRREKLKSILRIQPLQVSKFDGLLIKNQ